jgi:L-seryl-tRNA(Ser) seleniumtransferase
LPDASGALNDDPRRRLPSVDQILRWPEVAALVARRGRPFVLRELRALLERWRGAPSQEPDPAFLIVELRRALSLSASPSLVPVINATGVVIHTNLGRAPLSRTAAERVAEIAQSYSNLEYDLRHGERGDREAHAEKRLRGLLGAEATLVVNNNAAAVMLAVNTFAEGREAVVSRGELVEIGGSFRIPDVLKKAGARLVEVGTTNRTRVSDFEAALSPDTGVILKVHPSNFRIVGFTETPGIEPLVELARRRGVPLVEDLGSGLIDAIGGLSEEPAVAARLEAGVDVVTFSGDKLLGGPQAGLLAGRAAAIERMRRNPLYRALRVDKMTIAALDAVLIDHQSGLAGERLPVLRMLGLGADALRARAEALALALRPRAGSARVEVVAGESAVGGGAAPAVALPSWLVAIDAARPAGELLAALRAGQPPVVGRVADGRLLLDLRTVFEEQDAPLRDALAALLEPT